jgi:hypothetical protein
MGTTTNNGWPTPVATDLVKDGWEAIKDLGDAIDTTLGVYAPSTSGLTLINTTSFSGVASQTISNVFSSTYDNYKIILSGGSGSTAQNLLLTLGSTVTGYHFSGWYVSSYATATLVADAQQNIGSWTVGFGTTNALSGEIELQSPNLAKRTTVSAKGISTIASSVTFNFQGFLNDATQYTAFTITPSSGTITGTARVYGYNN